METVETTEKRCPGCGEVFPREHFARVKASGYRDGVRRRSLCPACHTAQTAERNKAARAEARAAARGRQPELTTRDAAALIGVSVSTVRRLKRRGELPKELTPAAVEAYKRKVA